MYLYKAKVVKGTAEATDFVASKGSALLINDILLADNTFVLTVPYATFKANISAPISWSDVKYVDGTYKYMLYLMTDTNL
jgi:hypothetical protein